MDIYSDIYYHLLLSFGWRLYYCMEGIKFQCDILGGGGIEGIGWIPRHDRRWLHE